MHAVSIWIQLQIMQICQRDLVYYINSSSFASFDKWWSATFILAQLGSEMKTDLSALLIVVQISFRKRKTKQMYFVRTQMVGFHWIFCIFHSCLKTTVVTMCRTVAMSWEYTQTFELNWFLTTSLLFCLFLHWKHCDHFLWEMNASEESSKCVWPQHTDMN